MPMDYPVFEPNDENLAKIICKILEKRGYIAGYQTSYPQHTIFIKVDDPDIANNVSKIIRNFMERYETKKEGALTVYNYDESIIELAKLIPETEMGKQEKMVKKILEQLDEEKF